MPYPRHNVGDVSCNDKTYPAHVNRDAEAVKAANFCGSRSWKQWKSTAFTLAIHIERQKLEYGAFFCEIFHKK